LKRLLFLVLILSASCLAAKIDIGAQLKSGDYESAYDLLLNDIDSIKIDEGILYYLCITAPSGKGLSRYLKEYTQQYPDGKHIDEIKHKLCDYYSSQGMDITAAKSYQETPEIDSRNARDIYKIALAKQRAGEYDAAREIYRLILLSNAADMESWALLGLADCDLLAGKHEKAADEYENIINLGAAFDVYPLALLGLSEAHLRAGNTAGARDDYGLYRQSFPEAPSMAEFEAIESDANPEIEEKAIPSSIKIAYYVQVGVFGKKDNAKACLRRFRNLSYQAKIDEFTEGGQKFQRVMIGPFKDEKSARNIKDELEKSQGEKFLIFVQ